MSALPPQAEFDLHCDRYRAQHAASIRASGEDVDFFAGYKAADALRLAETAGLAVRDILDFGSGVGNAVAPLREAFPHARLTCLDVSARSLEASRRKHGDDNAYVPYDGQTLPFAPASFDLAFAACVFHHIPHEDHVALLAQIRASLRPGGLFVLYEHNPWNPLTRQAVANCPFDENALLISAPVMAARLRAAGLAPVTREYRMFFPRALAALRPLERFLKALPLGAQYVLGGCA